MRVARQEIVALLAPTLGLEKSEEVVVGAMRGLGLPLDAVEQDDVFAILDILGRVAGLIGVAARFARGRLAKLAAVAISQNEANDTPSGSHEQPSSGRMAAREAAEELRQSTRLQHRNDGSVEDLRASARLQPREAPTRVGREEIVALL